MAKYETVCVVKPDIQGDRLVKITDKVKKVLSDFKIENLNNQDWGIRKLAYPIEKHKTAHYLHFTYEGAGAVVGELERQFNYDDAILRYLTVKLEKNDRSDIKPDNYQFIQTEAEGFGHPFGGPDRRERRFDRRGGEGRDFREPREPREAREPKEPKESPAREEQ